MVTIGGRDVYLGPWKSAASRREYDRVVGEWMARGRTEAPRDFARITVSELLAAYLPLAKTCYQGGSREVEPIKYAARPLRKLYGSSCRPMGPVKEPSWSGDPRPDRPPRTFLGQARYHEETSNLTEAPTGSAERGPDSKPAKAPIGSRCGREPDRTDDCQRGHECRKATSDEKKCGHLAGLQITTGEQLLGNDV